MHEVVFAPVFLALTGAPGQNTAKVAFLLPWRLSSGVGVPMTDDERFRLLFGPYTTPVFQYGDDGFCAMRGEVIVCGLTAARIPWIVGKRKLKGSRARAIILCGALVDAVRRESAQAVAYWWGITAQ